MGYAGNPSLLDAEAENKLQETKKLRRSCSSSELLPDMKQEGGKDRQGKKLLAKKVEAATAVVEQLENKVGQVAAMRSTARKTKIAASKAGLNATVKKKASSSSLAAGTTVGVLGTCNASELEGPKWEAQRSKRHVEIMRMVGTVLRQLMQHRLAWPFLLPVNPIELGLFDYFDVIKQPMDLGTIRDRMDGKGGKFYQRPQDVAADVRLVFSNAMLYNPPDNMFHNMAKALSEKFEEKWRMQLEPKIDEEEGKRTQEEAERQSKELKARHEAEEAMAERLANDVQKQTLSFLAAHFLVERMERHLQEMKSLAATKCRPMTVDEKRQLGHTLSRLPQENLNAVIQIIAQKNPSFNPLSDEVELDIDAQEPSTLWLLHHYVQSLVHSWPGKNRNASEKGRDMVSGQFSVTTASNVSLVEKPAGMTAAAAIAAARAKRVDRPQ